MLRTTPECAHSRSQSVAQAQIADIKAAVAALQQQLEESKLREGQLRAHNKVRVFVGCHVVRILMNHIQTLKEELRKVQSSAALLERQRNPGVGYWASRNDGSSETRSPTASVSELSGDETSSYGCSVDSEWYGAPTVVFGRDIV